MSDREATRPPSASNVVLPRLNSRIGNPSMQAIQEEHQPDGDEYRDYRSMVIKGIQQRGASFDQESVIPIASLFSSIDVGQPQTMP